jgi:uncharacterized protein (DUF608 family)
MKTVKEIKKLFLAFFVVCLNLSAQVNGTSGLPIGGIGTGAIKFNAGNGNFYANFRSPTRNGDYQLLQETQFQIFTQRGGNVITSDKLKAEVKDGLINDDAIFPKHYVDFGETNNISIKMTAYIPYAPESIEMMCHPCAMYEFTLSNNGDENVLSSIAFKIKTPSIPNAIANSGFEANSSTMQLCLIVSAVEGISDLSYGNDNGFLTSGMCNNQLSGTTNRLALRVSLAASETKKLLFILAWYKPDDKSHYRYSTIWNNARAVAESALNNFDAFKTNDEELVSRMRGSNLPSWLIDQTLNSLVNLVNNSVYMADGRYCHTEGQWTPEGTMDQMWHTRQIYTMINPSLAWQELEWWARTQHVQNYPGQIHHDFGENFNYVSWDNTEHTDYRTINEWVDLNCGFIISAYEAFIATADQSKLSFFWPYLKKASQRILDQVQLYGSSQFPYTFSNSLSSYDAGGNSQAYNTGLSIVAYDIMKYMADIMGEQQIVTLYEDVFQKTVKGFENRYLDNPYEVGNFCESALGGLWISNFLKLGPFWEKQKLDNLFASITNYYDPLNKGMGYNSGSYSEWQPYLIGHLGGYALQTNRTSIWQSLQKDMYERNYLNRNFVFNQQLGIPSKVTSPILSSTSAAGTNQYISIPVLWRNYYDIVGFHQNKFSGELWLEPKIIDTSLHQLQNALIISPEGYAKIDYNTSGEFYQNQQIVFKPDYPINVSSIYVWDLYSDSLEAIKVKVNGSEVSFERISSGDQLHLKLNWSGSISSTGITIEIEGEGKPGPGIPSAPEDIQGSAISPSQIQLSWKPSKGNISGYSVEIKNGENFKQISSVSPNDTSYTDTGLLPSKEYTYRIKSFNIENFSEPSEEIEVATLESGNGGILIAINAGGNNYLSSEGIQYTGDASTGWVSGGTSYSTNSAIANTQDDAIYQTERYGNFSYSIPLQNDNYNIVLKFAEIYQDNSNSRIFNVNIEGKEVLHNLDLFFRSGKNTAYDVVIPIELTDGMLNINFITVIDNAKLSALEIRKRIATSLGDKEKINIPTDFCLFQNYPNPFNPSTIINWQIPVRSFVTLKVFNILGKEVTTLVNEVMDPGLYNSEFSTINNQLPSGIYFYQIKSGVFIQSKKMILMK